MIVNETTIRHMFSEMNVSNLISTHLVLFISGGAIRNLLILSSLTKIVFRDLCKPTMTYIINKSTQNTIQKTSD